MLLASLVVLALIFLFIAVACVYIARNEGRSNFAGESSASC